MKPLVIRIPGHPVPQGRPRAVRVGKGVRMYDPAKSRNWKATTQQFMAAALAEAGGTELYSGPVGVFFQAIFACPKSDYRKKKPRGRRVHTKSNGDLDNILKSIMDAGTGVLWRDDGQVALVGGTKWIGAQEEPPGLTIKVREIEVSDD